MIDEERLSGESEDSPYSEKETTAEGEKIGKDEEPKFGSNRFVKIFTNITTVLFLVVCIIFGIAGYRKGIFTSAESMRDWVDSFGMAAPIIFVILQAVQVAVPIIPGGVTLLGGVFIFGPWLGFWYNYIGIVLGSVAVFAISRVYGKPLMYKLFSAESIEKYQHWTDNHGAFTKLFAIAIFLPGAPDGLICYLAGTTKMSWKTYLLIILICKPLSIALYSIGVFTVSQGISLMGLIL